MSSPFDIQCKNCGAPVGYDIVSQSYRCPYCGEVSGIQEARQRAAYRKMDPADRRSRLSFREVCSCPNCGAQVLFDASEESEVCSFCGSSLVRTEFELSDQFPDYVVPFVLTREEAMEQLRQWIRSQGDDPEARLLSQHLEELQGWYLPYILVRGPVSGYVRREHVNREFRVRGFVEQSLVNTSRQVDNEILDAAEPFDLEALKPFEHGYIAGHRVKLPDLSPAKRQRRTLQEASTKLKPQLTRFFHTDGIRVNLTDAQLLELPILLPVYLLKLGRRLVVVNGQTGRVAVKTDQRVTRSRKWLAEPIALGILILLILWAITGSPFLALVASPPLLIALAGEYRGGRFSVFGNVIRQGRATRAKREGKQLQVDAGSPVPENPFPVRPIFEEQVNGEVRDVAFRFYPFRRVVALTCKTLGLYFLPLILGGILRGLGYGTSFRLMGSIPWFWCFGIFAVVYIFSGIRCDAYEKPYVYDLVRGRKGRLLSKRSARRLPFCTSVGIDQLPAKQRRVFLLLGALMLLVSVCSTIL